MNHLRMPGRAVQPWCPTCHGPPGPDCPSRAPAPRAVRRRLRHELHRLAAEAVTDRKGGHNR